MDIMWFKQKQKQAGVTAEQISARVGRHFSSVSRILQGEQRMSLEWAQAFSDALGEPVDVILEKAGALPKEKARALRPGFSESDVVPFEGKPKETDQQQKMAALFGGDRPGIDVWQVKSDAMVLDGIPGGSFVLVDTNQSERVAAGDLVVAQKYDNQSSAAVTIFRRYAPPVLVGAGVSQADRDVIFVDNTNVVIRGRVIATWRDFRD